jgi:hypothetical protein
MFKVIIFNILTLSAPAFAYDFSPQSGPQQSKVATRWSLSQWMEQKGKIQWMDLWLNSNVQSPSFYEMYLGGDYAQYKSTTSVNSAASTIDNDLNSWRAHAGIFVSLLGVYAQYEKSAAENREQFDALVLLRVLGNTDQGSNLTGFYGVHRQNFQMDSVKNQQAGGYLTLYVLSFWALQGKYQHYYKNESDNGTQVDGHRVEASTWVEWGALRLYGTYYKEPLKLITPANVTQIEREGFYLGVRVYLDFKK